MLPIHIHATIKSCLEARDARDRFEDRMVDLAEAQGAELDDIDLDNLVKLAERYVNETLRLLDSLSAAGKQARVDHLTEPLTEAAVKILTSVSTGGLFGAICRSFAARQLIARASAQVSAIRGTPLVAVDPHREAALVASIIGYSMTRRLNAHVAKALEDPRIRAGMMNLYMLQGALQASGQVDHWSGPWSEDVNRFARAVGMEFSPAVAA